MLIAYSTVKEKCLFAVSESLRRGDIDTFLFFSTLSQTGFRSDEILHIKNWQLTETGNIYVPSHKKGNAKVINQSLIPDTILNQIRLTGEYRFNGSLRTYQRLFVQYSGLHNCYVGRKRITLHAFRHVFIKEKITKNVSMSVINQSLGIRNTSTTLHYIYKKYQSAPYDVDKLSITFQ